MIAHMVVDADGETGPPAPATDTTPPIVAAPHLAGPWTRHAPDRAPRRVPLKRR
ncbi:hypothetical protein [Streptomyces iakyrus]|uniref:hypothetical protein n=1 Tax=Streptomyces iakyrus TaxID=68219 RepID=UPI0037002C85